MSTTDELFLLAHILSAFWYVAGLTAVQLTLVRGWKASDFSVKAEAFDEASHYQGVLLVPGGIAIVTTGVFFWAQMGVDVFGPAWMFVVEACYLITWLFCLPLMGLGMRRARIASLQAERRGTTPELDEAMADNVPLVFGSLATILLVIGTAFSVFRPF